MVGGIALDGQGDDLPGLGIRLVLKAGLDLFDLHGGLVGHVLLQLLEQIVLGLVGGETGDALQHLQLVLLGLLGLGLGALQLGQAGGELLFFFLDIVGLAVQGLFLLLKAVLLALQVGPALLHLALVLVAGLEDLLLCFHHGLALFALGAFIRLVDDALGLVLCRTDLPLGRFLPLLDANRDPHRQTDHDTDDRSDKIGKHRVIYTSRKI